MQCIMLAHGRNSLAAPSQPVPAPARAGHKRNMEDIMIAERVKYCSTSTLIAEDRKRSRWSFKGITEDT